MEAKLQLKQEMPSENDEVDVDASLEEPGSSEMEMVIGPEFVKVAMDTDSEEDPLFPEDDNSNEDDMECWLPNRQNNQQHRKPGRGAKTRYCSNLKCNLCGREDFRRPIDLARHTTAHSWVRSQVCSVCGKAYIYWKSLKRHMARGHPTVDKETHGFGADKKLAKTAKGEENVRNHTCFMCQAKFNREAKLRNHFQTVHQFSILDSAAIAKNNHRQRRKMSDSQQEMSPGTNTDHRTHSQRRQLSCKRCGLLFARTSQLLQHRVIHQESGAASFTCGNCGEDLPSLASLRAHFCPTQQQLQLLQQTSTITITPIINNNNNNSSSNNKRQHIQENRALTTETLNMESGGIPSHLASELEVTRLHRNSSQPPPKPPVPSNNLKPRDVRRQELEVTCLSGAPQPMEPVQQKPGREARNPQLPKKPQALPLVKQETDVRPLPVAPEVPSVLVHKELELRYLPEAHYPQVTHGQPIVKRELEVTVLEAHQKPVPKVPSEVQGLDLSIKVKREVD